MAEVKSTAGDVMDTAASSAGQSAARVADLLRGFLAVQQRRAEAYSKLRRYRCCPARTLPRPP